MPSSVFASEFEEDVGLLNKAAPVSGVLDFLNFSSDLICVLQTKHSNDSFSVSDKVMKQFEMCVNSD